jgi:hypothetical protein
MTGKITTDELGKNLEPGKRLEIMLWSPHFVI